MTLITYSGRKLPLLVVEEKLIDIPVRIVKEKILDSFSTMIDKPVNVELKIKYV